MQFGNLIYQNFYCGSFHAKTDDDNIYKKTSQPHSFGQIVQTNILPTYLDLLVFGIFASLRSSKKLEI